MKQIEGMYDGFVRRQGETLVAYATEFPGVEAEATVENAAAALGAMITNHLAAQGATELPTPDDHPGRGPGDVVFMPRAVRVIRNVGG